MTIIDLSPAVLNIRVLFGDDFSHSFQWEDEDTGNAIDVSTWAFTFTITCEDTSTISMDIAHTATGEITVTKDADDMTAAVADGVHRYKLVRGDTGLTLYKGRWIVEADD